MVTGFETVKKKLNENYNEFRLKLIKQLSNSREDCKIIYHMLDDRKIDKYELESIKRLLLDFFKSIGLGGMMLIPIPGVGVLTIFLIKMLTYFKIEILPSGFIIDKTKSEKEKLPE